MTYIQHFVVDDINYFVTGCATFAQEWPLHENDVPQGSLKYFWADRKELGRFISFVADEFFLNATFMSGTGLELHQVTIKPRT